MTAVSCLQSTGFKLFSDWSSRSVSSYGSQGGVRVCRRGDILVRGCDVERRAVQRAAIPEGDVELVAAGADYRRFGSAGVAK